MITKAELLELARLHALRPTTVEKDYVLGWLLAASASHGSLARWVFKGGTCLKKCFFDTYRFSEDLDFTVPRDEELSKESIRTGLREVADWIEAKTGIQFPQDAVTVEAYSNPRGKEAFQAKLRYVGPLNLPRRQLQRVKFDLTQDELLADTPTQREVFHPYSDSPPTSPCVRCYSIDEILAEKSRALYERQGRARDVYDTVHLSRDLRESITPSKASDLLRRKFDFKGLPEPTVASIVARVDAGVLRANWNQQLAHQLPVLPPVESFVADLPDALAWWFEPARAAGPLPSIPAPNTTSIPRQLFPGIRHPRLRLGRGLAVTDEQAAEAGGLPLDRARFAARNRLCAEIRYDGTSRIVEPYSLRRPRTGNLLLFVYELRRGVGPGEGIKALMVRRIEAVSITQDPFEPRYAVEL